MREEGKESVKELVIEKVEEMVNKEDNSITLTGNLAPIEEVSVDEEANMSKVEKLIKEVMLLSKEERTLVLLAIIDGI